MDYEIVKMKDIAKFNKKSICKNSNYDYINYLDTANITKGKIDNIIRLDMNNAPSRAKRIVEKDDIIYSTVRPNLCHYGIIDNPVDNMIVSTGFTVISCKSDINPYYIYNYLTQNEITNKLHSIAENSTSAYPSIKPSDLESIEIKLPKLEKQNKIAKILTNIDKKIKLNSEINKNLLNLCRYKYDELNKNNDNWDLMKINNLNLEVTDYVANGSFKALADNVTLYDEKEYALYVRNTDLKVNFTDKRKYVDQKSYEFLKKSKLNGGELIISNVGDVGSVFICPHFEFPMTLGSNVIMLYSVDQHYYNYFLYFFFTSPYGQYKIKGITGGSAQPKFNKTDFRNMEINIPPLDVLDNFNKYIEPIYKRYELNIKENERLSELRDTLLPKLMNGEINLDNIEI